MSITRRILSIVFVISAIGSFSSALAAYNDAVFASSTITVSGYSLVLTGTIQTLSVRDSDFDVVLSSGSSLTIVSADKKDFGISVAGADTHTEACNSNSSSLVFTSPASVSTSTISIVGNCTESSVPVQVTSLSGVAGSGQATLSWSIPSDGGSAITDYLVEYKVSSTSTYSLFSDGVSISPTTLVTGLTNDTSYDMRVAAINANGIGASSTLISITPTASVSSGGGGGGGGGSYTFMPPVVATSSSGVTVPINIEAPGSPNTSSSGSPLSYILKPLTKGVMDNEVIFLQRLLNKEFPTVITSTDIIGIYGVKTEKAVKNFQCKYAIVCSGTQITTGYGKVGPKTLKKMNEVAMATYRLTRNTTPSSTSLPPNITSPAPQEIQELLTSGEVLSKGMQGKHVLLLQSILAKEVPQEFSAADIVGVFGPKTEKALKVFQCVYSIVCSGGPTTTGWGMIGWGTIGKNTVRVLNQHKNS